MNTKAIVTVLTLLTATLALYSQDDFKIEAFNVGSGGGFIKVEVDDYEISGLISQVSTEIKKSTYDIYEGFWFPTITNSLTEENPFDRVEKTLKNYPNPFNGSTNIVFSLESTSEVSLYIYDMNGRKISEAFINQVYSNGTHEFTWTATNSFGIELSNGSYLYELSVNPLGGTSSPYTLRNVMVLNK